MKIKLYDFLRNFVRQDEFISLFERDGDNVFNGTVKEFFSGEGWYPYVVGYEYSLESLNDFYVRRVGINYKGDGLEILLR